MSRLLLHYPGRDIFAQLADGDDEIAFLADADELALDVDDGRAGGSLAEIPDRLDALLVGGAGGAGHLVFIDDAGDDIGRDGAVDDDQPWKG